MADERSIRGRIARAAFRRRGSAGAGLLVRQAFAHASGALPVRRVGESEHVVAFHHPVPGFEPLHVLLVPKLSVASLMQFTTVQRDQASAEVEGLAREALERLGYADSGFLVIVNGGRRQDVGQVHFHLVIDGYALVPAPSGVSRGIWIDVSDPSCGIHRARIGDRPLRAGLVYAAEVHDEQHLDRSGYSIVWDARNLESCSVVHLTAGEGRGA